MLATGEQHYISEEQDRTHLISLSLLIPNPVPSPSLNLLLPLFFLVFPSPFFYHFFSTPSISSIPSPLLCRFLPSSNTFSNTSTQLRLPILSTFPTKKCSFFTSYPFLVLTHLSLSAPFPSPYPTSFTYLLLLLLSLLVSVPFPL